MDLDVSKPDFTHVNNKGADQTANPQSDQRLGYTISGECCSIQTFNILAS